MKLETKYNIGDKVVTKDDDLITITDIRIEVSQVIDDLIETEYRAKDTWYCEYEIERKL